MDDIDRYLLEDINKVGDITSDAIFIDESGEAEIIAKDDCIVAGLEEASEVFRRVGASMKTKINDGMFVSGSSVVAAVNGPIRSILKGERLALNFICRMSGIATETRRLVNICKKINPNINIAATRKTTPGFRKYEKKAVEIGGGYPHRFGLYDAVLIKDNHIRAAGSIEKAVVRAKKRVKNKIIEVEITSEDEALTVANLGVDVIMLDNISPSDGSRIAEKIRDINPEIMIEVSGGIKRENIARYASFADRISVGYITHSIKSMDFSLEII